MFAASYINATNEIIAYRDIVPVACLRGACAGNKGGVGVGGGSGDGFSFGGYGGIVGHARLLRRQRAWVEDSVLISCHPDDDADWVCAVQFTLVGTVSSMDSVRATICSWNDPSAPCVRGAVVTATNSRAKVSLHLSGDDVKLWIPGTRALQANLYVAELELVASGGVALDSRRTRFGVRSVRTDSPRIEFNGEAVFLRGQSPLRRFLPSACVSDVGVLDART